MNIEQFRAKYQYINATPVMQQYLDIRFANIDSMLLFRMGDFYELLYEDAITASRILGIALTARGKNTEMEIPMCGVPHHAIENYLHKLLDEGFKVAICDQTETPVEAKKLRGYKAIVNRSVRRIITPGTIIEESLLSSSEPNYLLSIVIDQDKASIAYIDLSASEIGVMSLPIPEILNEVVRLNPKEILMSEQHKSSNIVSSIEEQCDSLISFYVDSFFSLNKCQHNVITFYNIPDVTSIGELGKEDVSAIGSIIQYITLTQKENLPNLPKPKIVNFNKFMSIDAFTRRNLEINCLQSGATRGSLFSVINYTVTKAGSRLLYKYLSAPLIDLKHINYRLSITQYFYERITLVEQIRALLKKTGDLKRCLTRIDMKCSTPKDLLSIKYTIEIAEHIYALFMTDKTKNLILDNVESQEQQSYNTVQQIISPLIQQTQIYELINNSIREDSANAITDGEIIKLSYHPKLTELYDIIDDNRNQITKLCNQYRVETGIDTLKISNNNVIGLFIDITSRHANKITDSKFIHRQSAANAARYTTVELQSIESSIVNAKLLVVNLEQEIYRNICEQVTKQRTTLSKFANALSLIDLYSSFAICADEHNYSMPQISSDMIFEIKGGRHPIVESALSKVNKSFVGNNCNLSLDERIWLITGPNMSGKSTFLRQNAIIAILAQIGSYVPAESAKIGVFDKIFTRIGAGDNFNKGQSTFMLEMIETSSILSQATNKSLVILDEVGRGTSTYDGVSIAWSIVEHIHDKIKARCLFATHYNELIKMESILHALSNYTIDIDESEHRILFLHKIKKGSANKSYGVYVAELAGLPKSVINRSKELLKQFEAK